MLGFWQSASGNSNHSRGASNSSNNSSSGNGNISNHTAFAAFGGGGEITPRPSANPERNPFEASLSSASSGSGGSGGSTNNNGNSTTLPPLGQRSAPHSRKNSTASIHGIPAGLRTPTLQKSFVLPEVTSSVTATGLNTGSKKSGKDSMTATSSLSTNSPRLSAFPRGGSGDDGHSVLGANISRSTTPSRQLANPYPPPGSPKPSDSAAAAKNGAGMQSVPDFKLSQPPKQHQHHTQPAAPPGGPTPQQKSLQPQLQQQQPASSSKLSTSSSSSGTTASPDSTTTVSTASTRTTSGSSAGLPPPVTRKRDHGSHSPLRGKLTVKIIEARDIAASSEDHRPYVVATFEQNEFVSREAIDHDEDAVGIAVSPTRSSQQRKERGPGARAKQGGDDEKMEASASAISPTNPVWKHEVAFDVTQENSPVTICVYDRSSEEETFLGLVDIQPKQQHGWSVDDWYTLGPRQNEPVQGQVRVSIRFERGEVKRSLRASDFEFLRMIGKGTFGRVFQVRKRDTKRIYAMKVLSKREIIAKKEVQHTIGERKILQRSSDCPFLLGLKFSFQSQTELFLVMDFKSGGELFHHLQREGRFTEDRARFYAAEITLAFEYLHKYNIVYRDLKPENILLDATGHIVLCDFGLSKPDLPSNALTNTFCGTTEYLAPEVLLDDHGYSQTVDFWSLGVLLFEMCCGWSPFYAEDTQQMYKNICFGKIKFPRGVIGDDGKQFVKGLLNRNPAHRLGSKRDAAELKEHAFFKMIDWEALAARQVTVPFKPYVDSDESVSNFDPEFTEADILKEAPQDLGSFQDDSDLSGAWLDHPPTLNTSSISQQQHQQENRPAPVPIASRDRMNGAGTGPLGDDAQDAFRGFSYSGDGDLHDLMMQANMQDNED